MNLLKLSLLGFFLILGINVMNENNYLVCNHHSVVISTLELREICNTEELKNIFGQFGTYFTRTNQNKSLVIQKGINPKTRMVFSKAWIVESDTKKIELLIDNLTNINQISRYFLNNQEYALNEKSNPMQINP